MPLRSALSALVLVLAASALLAQAPPSPPPDETQTLARVIRDLLLVHLPDPVVESNHDWGQQKEFTVGLALPKAGSLRSRVEPRREMRNEGHWERVRIQGINPRETLDVGVRGVRSPEPGKTTFDALIGLNVRLNYEHQLWKAGVRLYSGETRARCRAAVLLKCELTNRTERRPGQFLPDVILRVRVTQAELFYQDLVCEHTAGVGGEAAEVIGQTVHRLLKKFKPGVEKDLLDRANTAVVRAADTKELRLELDRLLAGGSPKAVRSSPRK
jgi:hypothetical protein